MGLGNRLLRNFMLVMKGILYLHRAASRVTTEVYK